MLIRLAHDAPFLSVDRGPTEDRARFLQKYPESDSNIGAIARHPLRNLATNRDVAMAGLPCRTEKSDLWLKSQAIVTGQLRSESQMCRMGLTLGLWCSLILDANIIVAASVIAPAIGCGVAAYP